MVPVDAPGFFGKLPAVGDFVSRRLPREFVEPWDGWLQNAIASSRERLGQDWLDAYLTSPIWRFALSMGAAGPAGWAGVLMPSVDRVGRYFPFTVAGRLPDGADLFLLARETQAWFESAEELALSVLDDVAPGVEGLDSDVAALGPPLVGETFIAAQAADGIGWYVALGETGFADVVEGFLPRLAQRQFGAYSVWWTTGSEQVEPGVVFCPGLPDASGFAAMLAGHWQTYGWDELSPRRPDTSADAP